MHNEERVFAALFARIDATLAPLRLDLEIVCVDDGSKRRHPGAAARRASATSACGIAVLSRNFGKEAALTAGLDAATAT